MNPAEALRAKFEADLKELQDSCPHTELTDPKPWMWAPAHYGGFARWCKNCSKKFEVDSSNQMNALGWQPRKGRQPRKG